MWFSSQSNAKNHSASLGYRPRNRCSGLHGWGPPPVQPVILQYTNNTLSRESDVADSKKDTLYTRTAFFFLHFTIKKIFQSVHSPSPIPQKFFTNPSSNNRGSSSTQKKKNLSPLLLSLFPHHTSNTLPLPPSPPLGGTENNPDFFSLEGGFPPLFFPLLFLWGSITLGVSVPCVPEAFCTNFFFSLCPPPRMHHASATNSVHPSLQEWKNGCLRIAVVLGVVKMAETAVGMGADVESSDTEGVTCISLIAGTAPQYVSKGHIDTLRFLIRAGGDPSRRCHRGHTPAQKSIQKRSPTLFAELLRTGSCGHPTLTLMLYAIEERSVRCMQVLLERHSFSDARYGPKNYSLLHGCVASHCCGGISALLGSGANLEARDRKGRTPLFHASSGADMESMTLLLASGADINASDNKHSTPICATVANCHSDPTNLLLRFGASLKTGRNGVPPLALAIQQGHVSLVKMLLSHGADTTYVNQKGQTLMFVAAAAGNVPVILLLLKWGLAVTSEDHNGATPVHLAAKRQKNNAVRLLLGHGANPTKKDHDGHCVHSLLKETL